jgi:hypothetical protein
MASGIAIRVHPEWNVKLVNNILNLEKQESTLYSERVI